MACSDGLLYVHHLKRKEQTAVLCHEKNRGFPIIDCAYSPDGTSIAISYLNGSYVIYNLKDRKSNAWEADGSDIKGIMYSSCGNFVLIARANGEVDICDKTGKNYCFFPIFQYEAALKTVCYVPLYDVIVSIHENNLVHLWRVIFDVDSGRISNIERFDTVISHPEPTTAAAFNQSATILAIGYADYVVRVLLFNNQGVAGQLALVGHTKKINVCVFSPNEEWLISGSDDGTLRIWDTLNWRAAALLAEHRSPITAVTFLSNDTVLSVDKSGLAHVWNIVHLRPLGSTEQHRCAHSLGMRTII